MADKCPNCGFTVLLSPRERRSLAEEMERYRIALQEISDMDYDSNPMVMTASQALNPDG